MAAEDLLSTIPEGRNCVLMYHGVGDDRLFGDLSPEAFRAQIEALVGADWIEVVDLPDVLAQSPDRCRVAITFDDGFRTVVESARPVLHDYEVPATVFVNPGFLDGAGDPFAAHELDAETFSEPPIASSDQIEALVDDDLVTVGNHTATHRRLSELDRAATRREVVGAKRALESRFGITVDRFSYPYGDYDEYALAAVETTHELAVTSRPGPLADDPNRYRLARLFAHRYADGESRR